MALVEETGKLFPKDTNSSTPVRSTSCKNGELTPVAASSAGHEAMQPASKTKLELDGYEIVDTLGVGRHGEVKSAVHKLTGVKVALKFMDLNSSEGVVSTWSETEALKYLQHPHVVRLYDVQRTKTHEVLVLERCSGEMLDYIVCRQRLNEREARKFVRQILSALHFCHKRGVVHRDLKLENLLISKDGAIKIADFGFSNFKADGGLCSTFVGSESYAAPEINANEKYNGPPTDIWSLGVIVATILTGEHPFQGPNLVVKLDKIDKAEVTLPSYLSQEAQEFVMRIIKRNPSERPNVVSLWNDPWLAKDDTSMQLDIEFDTVDPDLHQQAFEEVLKNITTDQETLSKEIKNHCVTERTSLYHLFLEKLIAEKASNDIAVTAAKLAKLSALMKPKGSSKGKSSGSQHEKIKSQKGKGTPPPLVLKGEKKAKRSWLGSPAFLRRKTTGSTDTAADKLDADADTITDLFSEKEHRGKTQPFRSKPGRSESTPDWQSLSKPRLRNNSEPVRSRFLLPSPLVGNTSKTSLITPPTAVPTPTSVFFDAPTAPAVPSDAFKLSTDIDSGERVMTPVKFISGANNDDLSPRTRSKSMSAVKPARQTIIAARRHGSRRKEVSRLTSRRALLALRQGTPLKETTFGAVVEEKAQSPESPTKFKFKQGSSDDLVLSYPKMFVDDSESYVDDVQNRPNEHRNSKLLSPPTPIVPKLGLAARSDGDVFKDQPLNAPTSPNSLRKLKSHGDHRGATHSPKLPSAASTDDLPQSLDLATPGPSFGVSTTSSLPSHIIISELSGALRANHVQFKHAGPHKLICECRVARSDSKSKTLSRTGPPPLVRARSTIDALELLQWEMELCVLPHLDMYGIRLHRISGNIWRYKEKISTVMGQVKL